MYPSDFLHHKTTHDLLLTILYSELGVYSVASPHTMYVGVTLIFNDLRNAITQDLSEKLYSSVLETVVSRANDMTLFYDLYTGMNYYAACGADVVTTIQQAVFPVVAKMLSMEDNVRSIVTARCTEHALEYGDLVRHRMIKTLKQFNMNSYIPLDLTHVRASNS